MDQGTGGYQDIGKVVSVSHSSGDDNQIILEQEIKTLFDSWRKFLSQGIKPGGGIHQKTTMGHSSRPPNPPGSLKVPGGVLLLPPSCPGSTIGAEGLNFRVRD